MTVIDQYAYQSKLRDRSPAVKAFFSLSTLIFCVMVNDWRFSLTVFLGMAFACVACSGITAGTFLRLYRIPFGFILLGSLTMAFSYSEASDGLWGFALATGHMVVTDEGISRAAGLFMKSSASVACITFLYVSTSVTQILGLFDQLHFPPLFTELMMMVYRFVFLLLGITDQVWTAQKSRLGNDGSIRSLHSMGILGSSVFLKSIKRSNDIFNAMEARGYTGEFTYNAMLRPASRREKLLLGLYALFLMAIVFIER